MLTVALFQNTLHITELPVVPPMNTEPKASHFLVELTLKGALLAEELEAQRAFLRRLTDEGVLLLAGVLPEVAGRGLAVLISGSLQSARDVYAQAPVVLAAKASVEIHALKLTAGAVLR